MTQLIAAVVLGVLTAGIAIAFIAATHPMLTDRIESMELTE